MNPSPRREEVKSILAESTDAIAAIGGMLNEVIRVGQLLAERIRSGGCVLTFGNGGSAAQAQHLASELVGRFQHDRKPLAAIALTTDTSALTSVGNDYGFEEIFARQVRALARSGDVVLAISTSGNSSNVLRALDAAQEKKVSTIGLTGRDGGRMRERVDLCICAPSDSTPRIQEVHLVISHILCHLVESSLTSRQSRE